MSEELWALEQLARARWPQDWMFAELRPSAPGPMLEIGAGIGTFCRLLLAEGADPLVLVEPEPVCVEALEQALSADPRVEIAPELLPDAPTVRSRPGFYSYALVQDVLEHIEDDAAAVAAVGGALARGGELAVLVPAHPRLYGRLDRQFGHVRRYTRKRLRQLLVDAGAELVSLRSFNLLGVPGWLVAAHTERVAISDRTLAIYETLVRAWRPLEDALRPGVGLRIVARARKP